MRNNRKEILNESYEYVKDIFKSHYNSNFSYHNLEHTQLVNKNAILIANSYSSLSENDIFNLEIATLFHDIAFYKGQDTHEIKSVEIAKEFLINKGLDNDHINAIKNLILATKIGTSANNVLEEIIQDADLSHLGIKGYENTYFHYLFYEMNQFSDESISLLKWSKISIPFMENHKYKTQYAIENFNSQKLKNITILKKLY